MSSAHLLCARSVAYIHSITTPNNSKCLIILSPFLQMKNLRSHEADDLLKAITQ